MVPACRLKLAFVESLLCSPLHSPFLLQKSHQLSFLLEAAVALPHFSTRKVKYLRSSSPFLGHNPASDLKKSSITRGLSGQLCADVLLKKETKVYLSKFKPRASRATRSPTLRSIEQESRKNWLFSLSSPVEEGNSLPCSSCCDLEDQEKDDEYGFEAMAMEGPISSSNIVPDLTSSGFVIGVDPDVSGAIAVLKMVDNAVVAQVLDVPTIKVMIGKRTRRRHDTRSIVNIVNDLRAPQGSIAYVEQSMPFPKDGKQGWWSTGFGYGIWIGTLVASGFSVVPVRSQAWKSAMGLSGAQYSKDDSRLRAAKLFPYLSSQLQRKKDHGRAEALLIAAFGKGIEVVCD